MVHRIEVPFQMVDHHSICLLPFGFDAPKVIIDRLDQSPRWHQRKFRADDPNDAE